MAATRIEPVNATFLSSCPKAKHLGQSNIRPSVTAMLGCDCGAQEQVTASAATPAVHTIGSERCQLRRLGAWGHVVLETLGPHPAAPALSCCRTASSSPGKQQRPAAGAPVPAGKWGFRDNAQAGWLSHSATCWPRCEFCDVCSVLAFCISLHAGEAAGMGAAG